MPVRLTVRCVPLRSCFVQLPAPWAAALSDRLARGPLLFEIAADDGRTWPVSWAGGSAATGAAATGTEGVIELDASFAEANHLAAGAVVTVMQLPLAAAPVATAVAVEPLTPADWETVELHPEYLESQILNQVLVVQRGQVITVWVHHQTRIQCRIVDATTAPGGAMDPGPMADDGARDDDDDDADHAGTESKGRRRRVRLATDTELIIAPKTRVIRADHAAASRDTAGSPQAAAASQRRPPAVVMDRWCRVLPAAWLKHPLTSCQGHDRWAVVPQDPFGHCPSAPPQIVIERPVTLEFHAPAASAASAAHRPSASEDAAEWTPPGHQRHAWQALLPFQTSAAVPAGHIVLSAALRRDLAVRTGQRVRVRAYDRRVSVPCPRLALTVHRLDAAPLPKGVTLSTLLAEALLRPTSRGVNRLFLARGQPFAFPIARSRMNHDANGMHARMNATMDAPVDADGTNGAVGATASPDAEADDPVLRCMISCEAHPFVECDLDVQLEIIVAPGRYVLADGRTLQSRSGSGISSQPHDPAALSSAPSTSADAAAAKEADETARIDAAIQWLDGAPATPHVPLLALPDLEALYTPLADVRAALVDVLGARRLGGVLVVTGNPGVGKTTALTQLITSRDLRQATLAVAVRVDTEAWLGMPWPAVQRRLALLFRHVAQHAPAVLLIDQAGSYLGDPPAHDGGDASQAGVPRPALTSRTGLHRRATQLRHMVARLIEQAPVAVVLAETQGQPLHAQLRSLDDGFVQGVWEVTAPELGQRRAAVKQMLPALAPGFAIACPDPVALHVAERTSGYVYADMAAVLQRAIGGCIERVGPDSRADAFALQRQDIAAALNGFLPRQLHVTGSAGATGDDAVACDWDHDVVGMDDVKAVMLETLLWPTQYARVFAQCPLRLRSGLLLYGVSGTGKTLLCTAVAQRVGLPIIKVKGPELLGKYIGQSEAAVRDVFRRAKAAQPSILLFDEFESICPRRGGDHTGVTDRVVNQFLTELDGAEGLTGVFVLATTSRPDLIDAALLRPGRLDRSLRCGLPDLPTRRRLLARFAAPLALEPDALARLPAIAEQTEGYAAADLRAILYDAHLAAAHALVDQRRATASSRPAMDWGAAEAKADADARHGVLYRARDGAPLDRHDEAVLRRQIGDWRSPPSATTAEPSTSTSAPASSPTKSWITAAQLQASADASQPSVAPAERRRLEAVYRRFNDASGPADVGVRQSLG